MSTTTKTKSSIKNENATAQTEQKNDAPKKQLNETSTKVDDSKERKTETFKEVSNKLNAILQPTVKGRLNRLETLQILAEKYERVSKGYDSLTHFMASNDKTDASMKFASASNYSFTLKNPVLIEKVLLLVEAEFSQIVENAEKEVLEFQI